MTLLIWFGGLNEPGLSVNAERALGVEVLSFGDTLQDWYTSNYDERLEQLRRRAADHDQVFLAGQSSGGYAALRFALDFNPTAVFAFSPVLYISKNMPGLANQATIPLADLGYLYRERESRFPVVLNVGRSERDNDVKFRWMDHDQIAELKPLDSVTVMVHPVDVHYVSVALHRQQRFYPLLKGLMAAFG